MGDGDGPYLLLALVARFHVHCIAHGFDRLGERYRLRQGQCLHIRHHRPVRQLTQRKGGGNKVVHYLGMNGAIPACGIP